MAKSLEIIKDPNLILRNISVDFDRAKINSKASKSLFLDMAKTMIENDGLGLAAPQIGLNIRVIVINTPEGTLCMINPVITKKSFAKEIGEEGCLSIPKVFGEVARHKKISCKFITDENRNAKIEASGMIARAIQHEIDHLDGILFKDKAKNLKIEKTKKK